MPMKTLIVASFAAVSAQTPGVTAETYAEEPYAFALDAAGADTPEGARALYEDIQEQAKRVCREWDAPPVSNRRYERACREDVVAHAVETLDKPLVTALHDAETRG